MAKKEALGRGLDVLMSRESEALPKRVGVSGEARREEVTVLGNISNIDISLIEPNPQQPRTSFSEESLQELAASIKSYGVIQPITVRKVGDKYQLVSGERRLRASKIAGIKEIPAYITLTTDPDMLEKGLIENIQREDLNAIDVALSYQAIIDATQMAVTDLAAKVGKKRATISNYLRLLQLPSEVQTALKDDRISMGHARALITLEDDMKKLDIVRQIVANDLSVRQVEDLVRKFSGEEKAEKTLRSSIDLPAFYKENADRLSEKINAKVSVKVSKKGNGELLIHFISDEDLTRIVDLLQ